VTFWKFCCSARKARLDRSRQRRRHSARQTAKLGKLFGLFARLDRAIDFESLDNQPVDLVFLLLAPEGAGADISSAGARRAIAARSRSRKQAA